jgi:hypothetical protein
MLQYTVLDNLQSPILPFVLICSRREEKRMKIAEGISRT